jgi:hypothetical protein
MYQKTPPLAPHSILLRLCRMHPSGSIVRSAPPALLHWALRTVAAIALRFRTLLSHFKIYGGIRSGRSLPGACSRVSGNASGPIGTSTSVVDHFSGAVGSAPDPVGRSHGVTPRPFPTRSVLHPDESLLDLVNSHPFPTRSGPYLVGRSLDLVISRPFPTRSAPALVGRSLDLVISRLFPTRSAPDLVGRSLDLVTSRPFPTRSAADLVSWKLGFATFHAIHWWLGGLGRWVGHCIRVGLTSGSPASRPSYRAIVERSSALAIATAGRPKWPCRGFRTVPRCTIRGPTAQRRLRHALPYRDGPLVPGRAARPPPLTGGKPSKSAAWRTCS